MAEYEYIDSPQQEESNPLVDFDPMKLLRAFRKSFIWIMLIFLCCISVVYTYLYYQIPIYESASQLKLEMKGTASDLGIGIFKNDNEKQNYLNSEISIINSSVIHERIVEALKLEVTKYSQGRINDFEMFNNSPFDVQNYEIKHGQMYEQKIDIHFKSDQNYELTYYVDNQEYRQEGIVNQEVSNEHFRCTIIPTSFFSQQTLTGKYYFTFRTESRAQQLIAQNLSVQIINVNALTLSITYQDPNITKAMAIVNAADTAYLKFSINDKNRIYRQKKFYLQQRKDTIEKYMDYWKYKINFYKDSNNISTEDLNVNVEVLLDKMRVAQENKFRYRAELGIYDKVMNFLASDSSVLITTAIAQDITSASQLTAIITQIYQARQALEKLIYQGYTPKTFAYKQRKMTLDSLQKDFLRYVSFNKERLYRKIYEQDSITTASRNKIPGQSEDDIQLNLMKRYLDFYEKSYDIILNSMIETELAEVGTLPDFHVIQHASMPKEPIYPVGEKFYLSALAFAGFLSIVLVMVRYVMQNRIVNLKELKKITSVPILGEVPLYTKSKMKHSQLVIHHNPKSSISEALRSIRTNLDFMSQANKSKRIISVTSTISGEGKTFVAVNLAGIIALSEQKVVILDLDLRKPKIHFAFGSQDNLMGMSTLLIHKSIVSDCIRHSEIPNLDYITSGPQPPNPSELLLSERFDEIIKELHQTYDVVMFDMPPVGVVTDGFAPMKKADLPIFVTKAEYTPRPYMREVLNHKLSGIENYNRLSIVFNGVKPKRSLYNYGYGYGYGYGYRSGYYDDDASSSIVKNIKNRISRFFSKKN